MDLTVNARCHVQAPTLEVRNLCAYLRQGLRQIWKFSLILACPWAAVSPALIQMRSCSKCAPANAPHLDATMGRGDTKTAFGKKP
ncbi:uncharacterized protein J3R85_015138 [Psidium guajava]|nr:uncharacterized protein J3R85_015138 [Psidium guajava]